MCTGGGGGGGGILKINVNEVVIEVDDILKESFRRYKSLPVLVSFVCISNLCKAYCYL